MPGRIFSNAYVLTLDKTDVRQLKTVGEIKRFSEHWLDRRRGYNYIQWDKVAQDYAGIEICPYQSALRLAQEVSWYYSWDVASGCIWNYDAIVRVDELLLEEK